MEKNIKLLANLERRENEQKKKLFRISIKFVYFYLKKSKQFNFELFNISVTNVNIYIWRYLFNKNCFKLFTYLSNQIYRIICDITIIAYTSFWLKIN